MPRRTSSSSGAKILLPPDNQGPYSIGLVVRPDRVRLTIRHEGQDILSAWSYIKGPDEADLMQAISYAAHLCYKLAEQNKLAKDK